MKSLRSQLTTTSSDGLAGTGKRSKPARKVPLAASATESSLVAVGAGTAGANGDEMEVDEGGEEDE